MDTMSFDILPFSSENIKIIIFGCAFLLGVFFFGVRASSLLSVFYRFIIFFFGKNRLSSSLINDIVEIEIFNFLYKKDAVSLRQKDRFEKWVNDYELDFRLLTKVGRKLDIETLKLRKLSNTNYIIPGLTMLLTFFIMIFSLGVLSKVSKDSVLLSFDKTNITFYIDLKRNLAEGFSFFPNNSNTWLIEGSVCSKNNTKNEVKEGYLERYELAKTKLKDDEFEGVCNLLNGDNGLSLKEINLRQYRAFVAVLILHFCAFLCGLKKVKNLEDHRECRTMIYKKLKTKRAR